MVSIPTTSAIEKGVSSLSILLSCYKALCIMKSIIDIINKFNNNKTILNGLLFSLFSFINKGFAFILLLILAKYIAPDDYGYLSLFGTVVMVIGYFIAISSESYFGVSFFREGIDGLKKTISAIIVLGTIVTVFLIVLLTIGKQVISTALDLPYAVLLFAIIISFTNLFSNILLEWFRINEKVFKFGLFSCGNALINFILSILLVKYMQLNWEGRVYTQLICSICFGGYGLWFFFYKKMYSKIKCAYLKMILAYSIPLIPHMATTFIRQGCDRYIINNYHTITDVGLFSFALNLVGIITMVGLGFNQSNSIDIYKVLGSNEICNSDKEHKLSKMRKLFLLIYFAITLIITVVAYIAIPYILPRYANAMNYFSILSVFGFFTCVYLVYTNYLFFFKKTRTLMYITFSSAILHLLLSLFLTQYNLYYTAALYGITQAATSIVVAYLAMKELNMNLKINC